MNDPQKSTIVIAGGSGFLGRRLAANLEKLGFRPVILSRNPESYHGPGAALEWDGRTVGDWIEALDGAEALINLTGKNVNCRPTRRNRNEILESRLDSVRVLGTALRKIAHPPRVWIQASSLAIYGNAGDHLCDESARVDENWPANVCTAWEAALGEALLPGMRTVILRIGFVLGGDDGALPFLAKLTRWGLGGTIGNGRQWISWLHVDDMIAIFLKALTDPEFPVICNATGPHPVTNRDLMHSLRTALKRPWNPPAPAPAIHLGCWLLGSDPVIALTGRRCVPAALQKSGFHFGFPHLDEALTNLFPAKN